MTPREARIRAYGLAAEAIRQRVDEAAWLAG